MATLEIIQDLVNELSKYDQGHPAVQAGKLWLADYVSSLQYARLPAWVRVKKCEICGGSFFWATLNGRWIPIIPIPIVSSSLIMDAFSLDFHIKGGIQVKLAEPGTQWLPHRMFCGKDRPEDKELGRLWDATIGKSMPTEAEALTSLMQILEDTEDDMSSTEVLGDII